VLGNGILTTPWGTTLHGVRGQAVRFAPVVEADRSPMYLRGPGWAATEGKSFRQLTSAPATRALMNPLDRCAWLVVSTLRDPAAA
jgi:hypothetical protein